jgi:aspartokinase
MALLNLEGSGMLGVPGIAHRLFGSLHAHGISVSLIAQVLQQTQSEWESNISFLAKIARLCYG